MQILMSRVSADGTNIYKTKIGNNNKTIRKGRPCSNQELRDLDGLPGSSRNHEELGNLNLEELLILKVQQRPALYNFRLPLKERMRNITKQMWIDIWRSLNGKLNADEAAKKWKSLRDTFSKIVADENIACRSKAMKKYKWKYYETMNFLRDSFSGRK